MQCVVQDAVNYLSRLQSAFMSLVIFHRGAWDLPHLTYDMNCSQT